MWMCWGRKLKGRCGILSVVAVFVLSACGSLAPVFKVNESLGPGEGGVLLMVHSEFDKVVFKIDETGFGTKVFMTEPFDAGVQFRMLKLPAGNYEIGSISAGNVLFLTHDVTFMVKAGVMNYPGDLFLGRAFFSSGIRDPHKVRLQFVDKQDRLEALLAERYPSLLRRYALEVRPVGMK